jgi:ribosomal protein S21
MPHASSAGRASGSAAPANDAESFEEVFRRFKRGIEAAGVLRDYRRKQRSKPTPKRLRDSNRAGRRERQQAQAGDEENVGALSRALDAFVDLASRADRETLASAAKAPTDVDALVTMLTAPASLDRVTVTDPLADARLRWVRDRERLLHAEGQPLGTREVAEILRVSRQAIAKGRASGRLVGVPFGPGRYVYPSWQFGPLGPLRGLRELRRVLDAGDGDAWTLVAFVLAPNSRLDDQTPLSVLRRGQDRDVEAVLDAARAYGEHGAE